MNRKNIIKYPDGSSYADTYNGNPDKFTYRVNSYEDLWHLGQILEALNHRKIYPVVTIPNLIDAQADKRFSNGQSFGLKLVCNFLDQFDATYKIFHPHNDALVEGLIQEVEIVDNTNFIQHVLAEIPTNNLILMSSDAGGFKPLMKLCENIGWEGETYSASKARSWDKKDGTKFVQQIDRQDFKGKDILIVDDLSIFGGTFKGLSKLLENKNVGKKYLAVSAMTVQNLGSNPVTNFYDKVYTTNAKFDEYYLDYSQGNETGNPDNLEIIKLF